MAALRFVNAQNAAQTAAEQWFERTLDDSANRRIARPRGYWWRHLNLYANITSALRYTRW